MTLRSPFSRFSFQAFYLVTNKMLPNKDNSNGNSSGSSWTPHFGRVLQVSSVNPPLRQCGPNMLNQAAQQSPHLPQQHYHYTVPAFSTSNSAINQYHGSIYQQPQYSHVWLQVKIFSHTIRFRETGLVEFQISNCR